MNAVGQPEVVLLTSPFVGLGVWEPVAALLRQLGRAARVVSVPAPPASPAEVLDGLAAGVPVDHPVILVAHSNAGLVAPALATRSSTSATVFVDAALPDVSGGPTPTVPPELRELLAARVDEEDLLPPWTSWWPDIDLAALVPDAGLRSRLLAEQPRVPAGYLDGVVRAPTGWSRGGCAYLAFGDTYAQEWEAAGTAGWPRRRLPGRHLHMLVDPGAVAGAVLDLVRSLDPTRAAARG